MNDDPLGIGVSLNETYSGTFTDTEPARPALEVMPSKPDCYIYRIDNSTLEKWQTCPRAAEQYIINGREKPGSPALNFGSGAHVGWEVLGRGGLNDVALQAAKEAVTEHFLTNPQPEGEYRTLEYCVDMLEKYVKKWSLSRCSVVEHDGTKLVEFPFSLCIGEIEVNTDLAYTASQLLGKQACEDNRKNEGEQLYVKRLYFFWSGKVDQIVEFDDRRWVMDHKTTSMGGATFYADFELSQQTIGYVWAARQMFDFEIEGFLLDAAFCRRVTKTGKGLEFDRQFFTYSEWHLQEWMDDIKSQIGSFIDQLVAGYFPKKTKWCMGKYGACPYHDVCTLPPDQRKVMLNSSAYGNVTWSPLKK